MSASVPFGAFARVLNSAVPAVLAAPAVVYYGSVVYSNFQLPSVLCQSAPTPSTAAAASRRF